MTISAIHLRFAWVSEVLVVGFNHCVLNQVTSFSFEIPEGVKAGVKLKA